MDIEQKYQVNHYLVFALLNYVDNMDIEIPEIQSFVLRFYYKSLRSD